MKKISRSQDTQYLSVYQIWGLYIIFKAMNAYKWLWPIFGCKVGQSVQIGMKHELDVWHQQLDVYAKFLTDISKHVQKKFRKTFRCLGAIITPTAQYVRFSNGRIKTVFVNQPLKLPLSALYVYKRNIYIYINWKCYTPLISNFYKRISLLRNICNGV